jgi:hypothetical protein
MTNRLIPPTKLLPVIATVALALNLFLFPVPAQAVTIIDFDQGSVSGGVYYTDGVNASGTNIPMDILKIIDSPVYGPGTTTFDLTGDGSFSGNDPDDPTDSTAILNFDTATNSIEIIGGVPALSIPNGTTLLSGSFSNFALFDGPWGIKGFLSEGPDTKNPDLLMAIGLSPDTPFRFFGFTIATSSGGEVFSADIANTAVPEPSTLLLLGSGLMTLGFVARQKRAQAKKT